jgi:dCMP deaminase
MTWDSYFLDIAETVRQKSKDPSTKVGAVLVDKNNSIFSTGFNGFPIGIDESDLSRWERPIKYEYVCHAERNAIALAARKGSATGGATIYLVGMGPPTVPCTECTKMIIQSGVIRVVGRAFKSMPQTWEKDFSFSLHLLVEAGIEFIEHE